MEAPIRTTSTRVKVSFKPDGETRYKANLLEEANFLDAVPVSVTENTTRHLVERAPQQNS
jgi:hypothetical protein